MAIAVLPPQDLLTHHRKVFPSNNPRRDIPTPHRSSRRTKNSNSPPPPAANPTGPKSRKERARRTDRFFAGSTVVTSPPPSSVPLPAFFTARRNCALNEVNNLEIESELKRVLRLC